MVDENEDGMEGFYKSILHNNQRKINKKFIEEIIDKKDEIIMSKVSSLLNDINNYIDKLK